MLIDDTMNNFDNLEIMSNDNQNDKHKKNRMKEFNNCFYNHRL
jgi:hypothetical protein